MSRRGEVREKFNAVYEPIASVPDGIRWHPTKTPGNALVTTLRSTGDVYRLRRDRETGALWYFKRRDLGPEKSPAELIDKDDPVRPKGIRYNVGKHCWLIIYGRWYCCAVVGRTEKPDTITLRPTTGWDAERLVPWPHGETLGFSMTSDSFNLLRPLNARQR